jgi:hypothetical protein
VETKPKQNNGYDPRKRDPEHSNADKTCLWELVCSPWIIALFLHPLMHSSFLTSPTSTPLSPSMLPVSWTTRS